MDAAGPWTRPDRAPTAPWKSLRDFHSAHSAFFFQDGNNEDPNALVADRDSGDTDHPTWVAGFQTFLSGRFSAFGDSLTLQSASWNFFVSGTSYRARAYRLLTRRTTVWNQQVEVGEPDFHQLEPDGELAQPAPGAPRSRIVKRAGVYEALPADRN